MIARSKKVKISDIDANLNLDDYLEDSEDDQLFTINNED